MAEITVGEVSPARFEELNAMCVPSGPGASDVLSAMRESAEALQQASAAGLRVFGAFLDSEPVGRLELSPIEAAPVPLTGQGAWVIRCFWVLEKAKGLGLGRRLIELALDSVGTEPVAVLTYDDWMPAAFLEKCGFREAQRQGDGILMVRLGGSAATKVSFAPVKPAFDLAPDFVRVDAVYTPRCPWRIAYVRRRLADARELSDRVVTYEHHLNNREDALRLGEEYIYIDGEPLSGGPISKEVFLQAVKERLGAKGLIPRS